MFASLLMRLVLRDALKRPSLCHCFCIGRGSSTARAQASVQYRMASSDTKTPKPKSEHVKSEEISRGKWISLQEITYKDPKGAERKWEVVERTTKIGSGADAVVMVPVLKRILKFDCVILVKQYRPPLKAYTLEFPAGLVDKGENPFDTAVRELKEETGYVGVAKHSSPVVCLDPGLSSGTIHLVTMEVDGDIAVNHKPAQQQDESEFIDVITVQIGELLKTLNKYSEIGVVVHSILYTYAVACTQTGKVRPKVAID